MKYIPFLALLPLLIACTTNTDFPANSTYACGPSTPEGTPCGQGRACNSQGQCVNNPGGAYMPCRGGGFCDPDLKCDQNNTCVPIGDGGLLQGLMRDNQRAFKTVAVGWSGGQASSAGDGGYILKKATGPPLPPGAMEDDTYRLHMGVTVIK